MNEHSGGYIPLVFPNHCHSQAPLKSGWIIRPAFHTKRIMDKLKPYLITALIAILAVGLFSRFAPMKLKMFVNG